MKKKKMFSKKRITIFVITGVLAVLIVWATMPFVHRLQDNLDRGRYQSALTELQLQIYEIRKTEPNKVFYEQDIQNLVDTNKSGWAKNPYHDSWELRAFPEESVISGPDGNTFIDYDALQVGVWYYAYGECGEVTNKPGEQLLIIENHQLKRVGESGGSCSPF